MGGILPFEDGQKALSPGDKLILHTDGITEYQNRDGTLFGDDRFFLFSAILDFPPGLFRCRLYQVKVVYFTTFGIILAC